MSETFERRLLILQILSVRRFDTIANLAFELKVHKDTIRRDIRELSLHYPLLTTQGHGGGVKIVGNYVHSKQFMTEADHEFFKEITNLLNSDQIEKLNKIIIKFTKPKN